MRSGADFLDQLAEALAQRLKDRPPEQRLFNLEAAAAYMGMTPEALRAKVAEGKVRAVRIDRVLRFDRHDLDRLIDSAK
jgi:hypothetical protein